MSAKTCSKKHSTCKVLSNACVGHNPGLPQSGFPVPYISASDGVLSFFFWAEPDLWLGNEFYRKTIMTLAFLCWRSALFAADARTEIVFST